MRYPFSNVYRDTGMSVMTRGSRSPTRLAKGVVLTVSIEEGEKAREKHGVERPQPQPLPEKKHKKPTSHASGATNSDEERVEIHQEFGPEDTGPYEIAFPFSDTPVINRNTETRKRGGGGGSCTSILGMRGRRASSLFENGHFRGKRWIDGETLDYSRSRLVRVSSFVKL
jgi:hypothetical protein